MPFDRPLDVVRLNELRDDLPRLLEILEAVDVEALFLQRRCGSAIRKRTGQRGMTLSANQPGRFEIGILNKVEGRFPFDSSPMGPNGLWVFSYS